MRPPYSVLARRMGPGGAGATRGSRAELTLLASASGAASLASGLDHGPPGASGAESGFWR